jgi:hypothetical protein
VGGLARERTRREESEHQAANANAGGPQPTEERAEVFSEQLGQTSTSRTISEPPLGLAEWIGSSIHLKTF